jgi:GNAT superfamily N-acetyltransferase
MPVELRRVEARDIPTLFHLRGAVRENRITPAELAELGITPAGVAALLDAEAAGWIAEEDGSPLGFTMALRGGELFTMAVLPEAEGRGIGARLLDAAETWLAAQGVDQAWLLTPPDPALRAPGFYAARGWTPDGPDEATGEMRYVKRLRG